MPLRHRNVLHRVLTGALLGTVALAWSGCTAKKQTEYVAGISTQVQVPRDMKAIRVDLYKGGINVFCQVYKVYNGRVQLPNSLGSFRAQAQDDGVPLTVTITGFTDDFTEGSSNPSYSDCQRVTKVTQDSARVLRRSRQPYQTDKILFLPMPLKYSCFDVDCDANNAPGETQCKGGVCQPVDIDPSKLLAYDPDLVDGTGGNCFHVSDCMAAAVPAATVDDTTCTYAVPGTPSAPPLQPGLQPFPKSGDGVNVQVIYDGGVSAEVLDKDPDEGFVIPDPNKPQQFQLAPGLCALVHGFDAQGNAIPSGSHRITAIRTSGLCQPKSLNQPICLGDQLASMNTNADGTSAANLQGVCSRTSLVPSPAALELVVDDTAGHSEFFTTNVADTSVGIGLVNYALSNPAFVGTYVALQYFPGPAGAACGGGHADEIEADLARKVHQKILDDVGKHATTPTDKLDLEGALATAYSDLTQPRFDTVHRRAVIVIGNRGFDTKTCGANDPPTLAAAALASSTPIKTYVLELVGSPAAGAGDALAAQGGTTQPYDATANKQDQAKAAVQAIINDLTTCAYDLPSGQALKATAVLSFTSPVDGHSHIVKPTTGCTKDSDVNGPDGWGADQNNPQRIYFCGKSCTDYQKAVFDSSAYAALTQPPQQPVPVPVFAWQATGNDVDLDCAPKDNALPPGVGGQ